MTQTLSIGITTKDRPAALRACVESLALLDHLSPEVLIYDDGSKVPVRSQLGTLATSVRILDNRPRNGLVAGRNRLVAAAGSDFVLLLDDDTRLLTAEAVESAIDHTAGSASGGYRLCAGRSRRPPVADRHAAFPRDVGLPRREFHRLRASCYAVRRSWESAGIARRWDSTEKKRNSVSGCSIRAT